MAVIDGRIFRDCAWAVEIYLQSRSHSRILTGILLTYGLPRAVGDRMSFAWQRRAFMFHGRISVVLLAGSLVATCAAEAPSSTSPQSQLSDQTAFNHFVESNCLDCHNNREKAANLAVDDLIATEIGRNQPAWEKVVRKLAARQMPPSEIPRPKEKEYEAAIAWLESSLDAAAAAHPNPGRTETFRRLNRTEYQNAIRDLLGIEIDVAIAFAAG